MPEIAEVRTVARTLNERIVGEKIIDIDNQCFIYNLLKINKLNT